MSGRCASTAKSAKNETDKRIGKDRYVDRYFQPVIDELGLIFPKKLAQVLALHSGKSQRVCELWLEGKTAPGGDALAALICSEIGDTVLLALTKGCDHAWLRNIRTTNEIAKLRRQQRDSAARLASLELEIR
jgi:hypothetical protein